VEEEPPFRVATRWVPEEEELAERGVDLSDKDNARMRALTHALRERASPYRNTTAPSNVVERIVRDVEDAWAMLAPLTHRAMAYTPVGDGSVEVGNLTASPHPRLIHEAWVALGELAVVLAATRPEPSSVAYAIVREIVQTGAMFPSRASHDSDNEYRWASWSPSPRTEALQAAAYLAKVGKDREMAELVSTFAKSDAPSERFLAVRYAPIFAKALPEVFREIAEGTLRVERNEVVLSAGLAALWHFVAIKGISATEASKLVAQVIDEHYESNLPDFVALASQWIVYLAITEEDQWAQGMIERATVNGQLIGTKRSDALGSRIFGDLLGWAMPATRRRQGSRGRNAAMIEADAISARAWVLRIIDASGIEVHELHASLATRFPSSAAPEDDSALEQIRARHALVDSLANWMAHNGRESPVTKEDLEFLAPVLEAVVKFAEPIRAGRLAAPTTHRFIEFLNTVVDADPARVVHFASQIAAAGGPEQYQLDHLAVDEVVKLVEYVLGNHRDVVADGTALSDMLRLLDLFADQGWPEAMRLVWRLDEVYR
jgi:hypothetical protein